MGNDLVKRLREFTPCCGLHCEGYDKGETDPDCIEAADHIEGLERKIEGLTSDVETWRREALNNIDALEVANRRIVVLNEALEEIAKFATRKSIGMVHRLQGGGK